MHHFDVVIVGGGPAGASLGFLLQKAGINNCIIDKNAFPRDKLCGGLLTKKTASLLKEVYKKNDFPYEKVSSTLELFLGTQKLSSVNIESVFYLVERRCFDNYLIEQYKSIGGMMFENRKVLEVNAEKKCLILDNKEEFKYNILVGADGANSQIRKFVDKRYRPNAMCIEVSCVEESINNNICVYFSTIKNGYGWCFPKKNYYSIGIGGVIKQNKNMREAFMRFINSIGKSMENNRLKGAMIPFGQYVKKPYYNNIILIGDAAGLVDPITGEGIYFALYSAKCAYESIINYFYRGLSLETEYAKNIKKIHLIINDANWFKKIFFNEIAKKIFLRMLSGHKRIVQFFCENILADYKISYMKFPFKYLIIMFKRKIQNINKEFVEK